MSKGEIVGHISEGLYRVRQMLATDRIKAELVKLNERIAELAVSLPTAKLELLQANQAVNSTVRAIELEIPKLQAGVDGAREKISELEVDLIKLRSTERIAEIRVSELIAENLSALKRRNQLESVPEGKERELWCADYTLDLEGEVGIVDVNDEGGQGAIIQPGFDGDADYSLSRDGALFPNIAQSGPQIYFNAAVLPGVQKWMPRYRLGRITKLQADVCTVALDTATSSAQDLQINQTGTLSDIPIVYMDCNGSAFEIGDRVLVRFTPNGPLVVGFEKEPVPCELFGFVFEPARISGRVGTNNLAVKQTFGEPFESGGAPINSPLGTVGGSMNAWTAIPDGSGLEIERGKARNYGNKNWFNSEKVVLSWHGPAGRAHYMDGLEYGLSGFRAQWKTEPYVYSDLRIILDLSSITEAGDFDNVFGASIYDDGVGGRWLVVIASDKEYIPLEFRESFNGQNFKAFRIAINSAMQVGGPIELLHQYTMPREMVYNSHFYFSAVGDKAVFTILGDMLDDDNMHIDIVRYDVLSGFSTEQIWTRSSAIGSRVEAHTWSRDTDTPGVIEEDATLNISSQAAGYQIPIYCDFVGDREVIAYENRPAIRSTTATQYSYSSGEIDNSRERPAPITRWSGSKTETEIHSDVFSVVTSTGNTIFEMPFKPARSISFSYNYYQVATVSWEEGGDNFVQEGYGYFNLSNNENAYIGGIDWKENILSIDIRFDFCAVSYGGYEYALTEAISTSYDDPEFSSGGVQASGSVSGNEIVEVVEFWLGGEVVEREDVLRGPGSITVGSYSADPIGELGITGSNSSSQTAVNPDTPLEVSSKDLLTAAAYRSGRHSIGSVAMNYDIYGERKSVLLNHVSGYSDPVQEILERSEDDDYLICSVSIV